MKYLVFNNKVLVNSKASDHIIKYFYKKYQIKSCYFTNTRNFLWAKKFLEHKDQLNAYQKIYFLFENLSTKDYLDYPVYTFFYGQSFLNKKYLSQLILKNEDKRCIKIINEKLKDTLKRIRIYRNKSPIIISFDNYHLIQINDPRIILIYKTQLSKIYQLSGKYVWIHLGISDEFRFLNFSQLKIYGKMWDPFMNWKKEFLFNYNFELI